MHITSSLLQDPARQRFFITEGGLDANKLRQVGRIFIHSRTWDQVQDPTDAVALDMLKAKLAADLDAEIRLIETTMSITRIFGLKVVALKPAGSGKPQTFEGLSMTVRREGYPEEIWLEAEHPEVADDEDACPEDPDGLHFVDCRCDVWPQI